MIRVHAPALPRTLALSLILSIAAATPASAQMFRDHDSNAPVDFAADRIEVQDRADRVVVSGNVNVTQAGMKLNSDRMTVSYHRARGAGAAGGAGAANPDIDRIDASGNVVIVKGDQVARGGVAIYDLNRRIITMLGNVQLTQGANRLTGGRLVIDLTSGRSTVDGRSAGPAAPGTTGRGGRVSGTFSVAPRTPAQ